MKRGIALIWAIALSAVLLVITGSMVNYIIKESRFSVQIEESGKAYGAAKSGIEWALQMLKNDGDFRAVNQNIVLAEAQATVKITGTNPIYIESVGTANGVTRKVEYKYQGESLGTPLAYGALNNTTLDMNAESFTLTYDFWGNSYSNQAFGLKNVTHNNVFRLQFKDTGVIEFGATDINGVGTWGDITWTDPTAFSADIDRDSTYRYRVTMSYVKDTAVHVRVQRRLLGGSYDYRCVAMRTIDLNGKNFGGLNALYFYSPGSVSYLTGQNAGDGTWAALINGTSQMKIDNIFLKK